jgi:dihydroorotase
VNPERQNLISKESLFYKCRWSPLEGYSFKGGVDQVFVNGVRKFKNGKILNHSSGQRLLFDARD